MRYFLLLFLASIVLASCSNKPSKKKIVIFENDSIPLQLKMKKLTEATYLSTFGFNGIEINWIQEFYRSRNYNACWINDSTLSDEGVKLDSTLQKSIYFGIPTNRLRLKGINKKYWIHRELLLTCQLSHFLNDLNMGLIAYETKTAHPKRFYPLDSVNFYLYQRDSLSFDQIFLKQGPTDTNYRFLSQKIYEFCKKFTLDKSTFAVKPMKEDSANVFRKSSKALISKGYLDSIVNENDEKYILALKNFQKDNGLREDGKVGKYTAKGLNESTYHKVLRAAIALDKMRQKPDYPIKFVRINIPEFTLRYYAHDSLKRVHRVIVGKPENQTPELNSKIIRMIAYPFWKVPYSIASKEILPSVKRSAGYLTKNNYKLYRGEQEVNPNGVNWSRIKDNTFPYQVIQQPGENNSLGIFKFEFHSSYSVYLHDTPTKYLFKADIRAYSHGCIRCEEPLELAKAMLDYDSLKLKRNHLTRDSLDSLMVIAKHFPFRLMDPVPIFIEYVSVCADKEKLIFYPDIYYRDEEFITLLKGL